MPEPITPDLLGKLAATQVHIDALLVAGAEDGFEVEVHAQIAEAGMRFSISLVRRIYAPQPTPPALKIV